ncbi:MAG: SH3 domain-containing protein [Elainella sp. Prado103]|jgi:hypothetical protein|nr:SH3 domain-containing protein [Elainella sp. Prado103]
MTMSLSGVFRFILGFLLAIALLFLAGAGLTRYMLARLATPPPRPNFPNDPSPTAVTSPAASPPVNGAASPVPSPATPPTPAPSPSPTAGFQARVIQPIGLIVRNEPNVDAAQVGSIEFNQELTVLEENADGSWQKVRLSNGTEGWVRGGNTEQMN